MFHNLHDDNMRYRPSVNPFFKTKKTPEPQRSSEKQQVGGRLVVVWDWEWEQGVTANGQEVSFRGVTQMF